VYNKKMDNFALYTLAGVSLADIVVLAITTRPKLRVKSESSAETVLWWIYSILTLVVVFICIYYIYMLLNMDLESIEKSKLNNVELSIAMLMSLILASITGAIAYSFRDISYDF